MKVKMPTKMSRTLSKVGFKIKKHSPELLMGVGAVGVVTSAVLACKATLKVDEIIEEHNTNIEKINGVHSGELPTKEGAEYTDEMFKKDLTIQYVHTSLQFAKVYAPAVILGGLSLGTMFASHKIMRQRNAALAAAYATAEAGFKKYRDRVIEELGEEKDNFFKYGLKADEVEETTVDAKGKEKTVKKKVTTADEVLADPYSFWFDEKSREWEKDAEYNMSFLMAMEAAANERLKTKGYLFLNDVLEMLDLPITQAGQIVGWLYNTDNEYADHEVKFGIKEYCRRDFPGNVSKAIMLNFNCDGNIYDRI